MRIVNFKKIIEELIPPPGHFLVFNPRKQQDAISKSERKRFLNIFKNKQVAERVYRVYATAHNNAQSLLDEAEILLKHGHYARAVLLAIMSFEELGKSQIAADFYTGVLSEDEYRQAFRVHKKTSFASRLAVIGGEGPNVKNGYWIDDRVAKELEGIRQKSIYVDEQNDPLKAFSEDEANLIIQKVKAHIEYITFAEEFNGRIGSKALFK